MNALPGYDAWKTTPPRDAAKPRPSVSTVTRFLLIEAGDVQVDSTATYSAATGTLVSLEINGRDIPVHVVESALELICPGDATRWSDDLPGDVLGELLEQAARDQEDERADYLRDLRMDD